MYDFLLTATDAAGERATHRVAADSAADAHAKLEAQGYREIVLHTDDASAATPQVPGFDPSTVAPKDQVEARDLSTFAFFLFLYKKLAIKSAALEMIAVVYLGYKLYAWQPLGIAGYCAIAVLLLPAAIAAWASLFGLQRKYDLLVDASAWGRWSEVLERTPPLRGKVPELELDTREAIALAGLGRLDEGLERLRPHEHGGDSPRWMVLGRLSEVYETANQHDEALRCMREAYELDPDNPTLELDYAMALLKNEQDPQLAAQLIQSAEKRRLSDLLQLFLPFIKGLFCLNTGQDGKAVETLNEARKKLEPLAPGAPLVRQILDINAAYQAIAHVRTGRRDLALKLAEPARNRLQAINNQRLLAKLDAALGPQGSGVA
ncbi:MAG: tetratricopeptide repeat protein [Planctomycetota bacterium]|nr:MAG: tetratricopeptide repeat protein [Planctomycetota bacterium]